MPWPAGEDLYCDVSRLCLELGHLKFSWRDVYVLVRNAMDAAENNSAAEFTAEGNDYSLRYHCRPNRYTLRNLSEYGR